MEGKPIKTAMAVKHSYQTDFEPRARMRNRRIVKDRMERRKTRSEGGVVLNSENGEWSIIPR